MCNFLSQQWNALSFPAGRGYRTCRPVGPRFLAGAESGDVNGRKRTRHQLCRRRLRGRAGVGMEPLSLWSRRRAETQNPQAKRVRAPKEFLARHRRFRDALPRRPPWSPGSRRKIRKQPSLPSFERTCNGRGKRSIVCKGSTIPALLLRGEEWWP